MRLLGATGGLVAMARTVSRSAPGSPLNVEIGSARRYATADTELDDYKAIRKAHGGTVNDVVLAVVAGGLRTWLMTRGESVSPSSEVRAMVPVSVRGSEEQGALGNRVSSYLVDLPVGEANPVMRLHQISYAMAAHKDTGQAVGADAIVGLAGFAPPTLHALGARVGSGLSRRIFNLVVTNVPGPQFPLYAAGARMLAAYPVVPLAKGQAVSIGPDLVRRRRLLRPERRPGRHARRGRARPVLRGRPRRAPGHGPVTFGACCGPRASTTE